MRVVGMHGSKIGLVGRQVLCTNGAGRGRRSSEGCLSFFILELSGAFRLPPATHPHRAAHIHPYIKCRTSCACSAEHYYRCMCCCGAASPWKCMITSLSSSSSSSSSLSPSSSSSSPSSSSSSSSSSTSLLTWLQKPTVLQLDTSSNYTSLQVLHHVARQGKGHLQNALPQALTPPHVLVSVWCMQRAHKPHCLGARCKPQVRTGPALVGL